MGDVIGDLNSRRGQIGELGDKPGGLKTVLCYVPLAEMFNYVSKLRGMTKGRANYSMKLARYEPVPMNIQQELQRPRLMPKPPPKDHFSCKFSFVMSEAYIYNRIRERSAL